MNGYREVPQVDIPRRLEYVVDDKPVVWASGRGWDDGWFLHIDEDWGKTLGLGPHACALSMNNHENAEQWVKLLGAVIRRAAR
jgi:hypothetical protein